MNEFTAEELFEAIDRLVRDCLDRHAVDAPPVDAMLLAQDEFDLKVREVDPDDEREVPQQGRFGPRAPKRPNRNEVVVRPEQSEEARQAACARACAKGLIPRVMAKLGAVPGEENRGAQNQLVGLVAPRLLLPTRWFGRDARKAGYDLLELKDRYPTAGYELIALRMLDFEEPCVIAVVDDGSVSVRRSNVATPGRTLTAAEQRCLAKAAETREPVKLRHDGWTCQAWPIPNGPFNRIILRGVPDDL